MRKNSVFSFLIVLCISFLYASIVLFECIVWIIWCQCLLKFMFCLSVLWLSYSSACLFFLLFCGLGMTGPPAVNWTHKYSTPLYILYAFFYLHLIDWISICFVCLFVFEFYLLVSFLYMFTFFVVFITLLVLCVCFVK